jgi:polysaccharide biosynthesis/export protein
MRIKTSVFTVLSFLILLSPTFAQNGARPGPVASADAKTPAVAPTGTSGSSAAKSADYRLVAGDKLRIDVYKDDKLSQSLQIRPDGKITLPLVGDVPAAGHTAMELRDTIVAGLKDYITNPVVTVIVQETTPQVVYVMGEVTKPGTFALNGRMSVVQALAMAGGFTDFANKKDIRILRKNAAGMQTIRFNYKDAIDDSQEPPLLQAGDTVIVK